MNGEVTGKKQEQNTVARGTRYPTQYGTWGNKTTFLIVLIVVKMRNAEVCLWFVVIVYALACLMSGTTRDLMLLRMMGKNASKRGDDVNKLITSNTENRTKDDEY